MSTSTPVAPLRWGILACGRISHDFVNAIRHLPDVAVVACAARREEDAVKFASLFDIPRHYGSYEQLVADSEVDVVYVGSLHPQHCEHAVLALEAGKHVLIEKPMALNYEQGRRIVEAARKSGKFAMEAMWSRFLPVQAKVRDLIASGVIGRPRMVEASFGFSMPEDRLRLWENRLGGGALLDLGVYPITLANMVFGMGGSNPPSKIHATGMLSEGEKVDIHDAITLQYGEDQLAVLSISNLATLPNEAYISGDKGTIHIHAGRTSWHCSERLGYKLLGEREETIIDLPEPPRDDQRPFNFQSGQLMRHECEAVMALIRAGQTESPVHTLNESLEILKIMDECRKQIGVIYVDAEGEPKQ